MFYVAELNPTNTPAAKPVGETDCRYTALDLANGEIARLKAEHPQSHPLIAIFDSETHTIVDVVSDDDDV